MALGVTAAAAANPFQAGTKIVTFSRYAKPLTNYSSSKAATLLQDPLACGCQFFGRERAAPSYTHLQCHHVIALAMPPCPRSAYRNRPSLLWHEDGSSTTRPCHAAHPEFPFCPLHVASGVRERHAEGFKVLNRLWVTAVAGRRWKSAVEKQLFERLL